VTHTKVMPERSKQPTVFWLVRLNYYYTSSLTRGIQNLLRQEPVREQKRIPGHAGGQNRSHIMDAQLTQACSGCSGCSWCSGMLRLAQACSPSAQVGSPSAQVKAAVAHVCRLKRNQRKWKLILSLWVFGIHPTRAQSASIQSWRRPHWSIRHC
jgi:hypothetical protein